MSTNEPSARNVRSQDIESDACLSAIPFSGFFLDKRKEKQAYIGRNVQVLWTLYMLNTAVSLVNYINAGFIVRSSFPSKRFNKFVWPLFIVSVISSEFITKSLDIEQLLPWHLQHRTTAGQMITTDSFYTSPNRDRLFLWSSVKLFYQHEGWQNDFRYRNTKHRILHNLFIIIIP